MSIFFQCHKYLIKYSFVHIIINRTTFLVRKQHPVTTMTLFKEIQNVEWGRTELLSILVELID